LADWRRVTSPIGEDGCPHELAQQFAGAIELAYSNEDIAALVASKGVRVDDQ
jgi:hypothetical protein